MDSSTFVKRKRNPKECANTFSLITFFYVNEILRIQKDGDIKEDHLFYVHQRLRAKHLGDRLEKIADKLQRAEKKISTIKLLILFLARKYIYLSILQLITMPIFVISGPFLLGKFVLFFSPDQTEVSWEGACLFGIAYVTLSIIQFIYEQNYGMIKSELRIEFQTALCSLIYRKSLRLSQKALSDITVGKIVSLISKDINVFAYVIHLGIDCCVGLIQVMIILFLFYRKVGMATFIGFALLLSLLPVQVYLAKIIKNRRAFSNKKSDERLQLTQEILAAIRIIKMYTWEKFFCKRISDARSEEMKKLRQVIIFKDISFLLGKLVSVLSFYMLISSYVWMGNTLSAELVYYLYSTYDRLEETIVGLIPISISQVGETLASLKRYNAFFNAPEVADFESNIEICRTKMPKIVFSAVEVKIQKNSVLNNISLEFRTGLNIILGNVGSGKSLLLKTILGEYKIFSGKLSVDGTISYAAQYPWLFPSTIKQNILFGEKYDEEKYKRVLDVCALDFDLKLLEFGDRTILGDCGINLSKGQQSRVNLARAIYKDSDIYLLDDCLSSLDPNVRRHIFSSLKSYLSNKIYILVTHHQAFIEGADNVVVMNEGAVLYSGGFNSLPISIYSPKSKYNTNSKNIVIPYDCNGEMEEIDEESELLNVEEKSINIYREQKNAGKVPISVYQKYILFGGGYFFYGVIVILLISGGTSMSYAKEILSQWVDMDEHLNALSKTDNRSSTEFDLLSSKRALAFNVYTIITFVSSSLWLTSLILHFYFASKISMRLHKVMVKSVLGSTMVFFDTNLIGNILNRFSKDIYHIDEELVYSTNDFIMIFVIVVSTATLLSSINDVFLISFFIFGIIFMLLGYYLLPIGRNLRRLNSSTRSPMVGYLNATLEGIATVRAWKNDAILKKEFDHHQDLYTSAHHTMITFTLGFSLILKMISSIYMAIIVGHFLFVKPEGAGRVGLSLTQVSLLTYCLESCLNQWVTLESQMTCFERALEYTDVEQEPKGGKIIEKWPANPSIVFKNVCLSYRLKSKKVLKNLNFRIESGEKVAIVGRTGAGKSSVLVALFRLYDPEGTILIDSVDTKTLPLQTLRENLTIIPQDPILFTGTIRSNLDPYEKYTTAEIWQAVKEVNLEKHITELDHIITDCGAHLSIGQRQLICIARALLDKHKIIILDEATANMDEQMESLIHRTIDKHFRECTVISISHRIRQVLQYDKLLVMEEGELVECGNPKELLKNSNGVFYKIAQKAYLV